METWEKDNRNLMVRGVKSMISNTPQHNIQEYVDTYLSAEGLNLDNLTSEEATDLNIQLQRYIGSLKKVVSENRELAFNAKREFMQNLREKRTCLTD